MNRTAGALLDVQPGFLAVAHADDRRFDLVRVAVEFGCRPSALTQSASIEAVTWGLPSLDDGQTVLLSSVTSRNGRDVSAAEVGQLLAQKPVDWVSSMLPPFGAVRLSGDELTFAVDVMGFRQLYIARSGSFTAVSTSARMVARISGSRLDRDGLAVQALLGWQVGDRTLFSDVETVVSGAVYRLTQGGSTHRAAAGSVEPVSDLATGVERAASGLRNFFDRYLDEHPDAVLQLTGGQDSRILLSAIARDRRKGLAAVTVEVPGSEDAPIAARLAARCGLRHTIGDTQDLQFMAPDEAYDIAVRAAARLDCMADPVALASLAVAEQKFDQGARISGLGGECARGFYYVLPSVPLRVTRQRVRQLAKWRMFANEAVAPESLEPAFAAWASEVAHGEVWEAMRDRPNMLVAGDEFYFRQRMRRWAGLTDTAVCFDRNVTNPMLDEQFRDVALGLPPRLKANSLFLARLQMALDSELGALPLDGRPSPAAYAQRSLNARVARYSSTIGAAARKVRQRMVGSRRPPVGGDVLAAKVVEGWRRHGGVQQLGELAIFSPAWLEKLEAGQVVADPATTALLINLSSAVAVVSESGLT